MSITQMKSSALENLKKADVMVPATLMINSEKTLLEDWQMLQTRYWVAAGAATVIPGAHSGQFALGDITLYDRWLKLNKEIISEFGDKTSFLMAAVSGDIAYEQAQCAYENGYDIVIVAPTAFSGRDEEGAIEYLKSIAEFIPVYGFYLQVSVGGRVFSANFWKELFTFSYGAKAAPFNRKLTDEVMNAAVRSGRFDQLVMATGNDDHIVTDLLTEWPHPEDRSRKASFSAGLLGHFCTDTHAMVRLVRFLKQYRSDKNTPNPFPVSAAELAADVTCMNYALFDSQELINSPKFQNAVWGTEYRQERLGLAPGNRHIVWKDGSVETGRPGLTKEIDLEYSARPYLTDGQFVKEHIAQWKKDIGMK